MVASGGLYGYEPTDLEYRRYFAVVRLGGLSLRLGRFIPAFGYNISDHTKSIKELFGQGSETLNGEISYSSKWAQITATRILSGNSSITTGQRPIVSQKDARDGVAIALDIPITKGVQLGGFASQLADNETVQTYSGFHGFAGNEHVYALAEYQAHPHNAYRAYGEVGWQPLRGIHIKAEYNATETTKECFATVVLYPYAHFELTGSMSSLNRIFVFHYYL